LHGGKLNIPTARLPTTAIFLCFGGAGISASCVRSFQARNRGKKVPETIGGESGGFLYNATKLISEDRGGSEHAVWDELGKLGSKDSKKKEREKKKKRRIKD
jgi:hypothetical protein